MRDHERITSISIYVFQPLVSNLSLCIYLSSYTHDNSYDEKNPIAKKKS